MKLTWERRQLKLRHPFNIARMPMSDSTDKTVLLVRIEHDGLVGWGEAAPISYYHQSLDSVEAMLSKAGDMQRSNLTKNYFTCRFKNNISGHKKQTDGVIGFDRQRSRTL